MDPSSQCNICLDVWDDPVVCSDGYAYCRDCISKWIGKNETWKSPRNNQWYDSVEAIRGSDSERALQSLAFKQTIIPSLSCLREKAEQAAQLAHFGKPVVTPATCRDILSELIRQSKVGTVDSFVLLDLAYRSGSWGIISPGAVLDIIKRDENSRDAPLVDLGVLLATLHAFTANTTTRHRHSVAAALESHLWVRAGMIDSVRIPADRHPSGHEGRYFRSMLKEHSPDGFHRVAFKHETSDHTLFLGTVLPAPNTVIDSVSHTVLEHKQGKDKRYISYCVEEIPTAQTFWRERRGNIPFPDSGSEEVETVLRPPPKCTILEEALVYLPHDFFYSSAGVHCASIAADILGRRGGGKRHRKRGKRKRSR